MAPPGAPSDDPPWRWETDVVGRLGGWPAAVVLDMDGLLLDTERLVRPAWQETAAELGHAMDDALYAQLIGRTDRDAIGVLAASLGPGFASSEFLVRAQARTEQVLAAATVPWRPGAAALLDALDEIAMPRAIATSTRRRDALLRLERSGIARRVAVVVCGDDVARGKPAPDIYLRAAAELGVAPAACVAFEDSSPGACAAAAAGMIAILVPDLCPPTVEARGAASAVVGSLEVVAQQLRAARRGA